MGRPAVAPFCLALLGCPLLAELPQFGVQVAVVQPESDLNGGKWVGGRVGASAGVHVLLDLDGGHGLCLRGDATSFRSGPIRLFDGSGSTQLYGEDAKARILALGADYRFHFASSHLEGPYGLLGAGWSWASLTGAALTEGGPVASWPADQRATSFQFALGLGWRFLPQVGGELRYTQSSFRDLGAPGTLMKAPTLSLGLTLDY